MVQSPLERKVFALYKPVGVTSFSIVKRVRKLTGIKKVGHAGTLDPFADGVLIIGVGREATKTLSRYEAEEKEYTGTVTLGIVTDTYDPTGRILESNLFSMPSKDEIVQVLNGFQGEISQLPPMFSAVKQNGVRLYKSARKGIEVNRKTRRVFIRNIELIDIKPHGFDLRIVCSKGTYIRTLAYDIGRKLGPGAHLSQLTRTRIGSFQIDEVKTVEEFEQRLSNSKRSL